MHATPTDKGDGPIDQLPCRWSVVAGACFGPQWAQHNRQYSLRHL